MKVTFTQRGDFAALRAAELWLESAGYSVGRTQAHAPIGIRHGNWDIAKWRNLSGPERQALDGQMTGDYRHGPVFVELFRVAHVSDWMAA